MSFGQMFWLGAAIFAGGYVASIFTWEKVHTFLIGAEEKALQLRDKARALEAKLRS